MRIHIHTHIHTYTQQARNGGEDAILEYAVSTEHRDRKAKTNSTTSPKSKGGTRYVNASAIARLSAASAQSVTGSNPSGGNGKDGGKNAGKGGIQEDLRRVDVLMERYGEEFHLAPHNSHALDSVEEEQTNDVQAQEARFEARYAPCGSLVSGMHIARWYWFV
jgi:hypothetical protein